MKMIKKISKNLAIFLMVLGILFSNIPFYALTGLIDSYEKTSGIVDTLWLVKQENNADVVDKFVSLRGAAEKLKIKEARAAIIAQYTGGLLVYADTVTVGTPKYKVFDDTTGFGVEQSASSVGASAINWIRVAASPVNDEWIIATRDAANVIKAQVCTGVDGGVSCGTPITITATAGTHGFRNFDVAYEQTSGDALLVYGTATVDELRKIEWTGGAWTLDAAITTTRTSGTVEWVELTSRPASNQIGIAYADTNDDISAYRWSGTVAADEATAVITASGVTGDVRKMDVSFEGTSGDMLVAAPVAAASTIATGQLIGTAWTIGTNTAPDNVTAFIDLQEPNPSDDDIAMIAHGTTAAGANTAEGYEWSGTGVVDGTVAVDASALNWLANYHFAATAYVSATYYAAAVFADTTGADDINWWTMNSAGTWTAQADNLRTRGNIGFIDLFDYPNLDKVLLISADANSDLWADTWDGTTPSATVWVDRSGGAALETSLSIATKDVVDFAFRLAPPPVVNTLTIGVTAGAKLANATSSATLQYINTPVCAASSTCAAFTLSVNSVTVTVSSIKITETGTVNAAADLSNLALFYDTDGNFSNGTTGQYGATVASFTAEAATVSGSLALTAATTYYFYVRYDAKSATPTYPKGGQGIDFQIAANGDVTLSAGSATNAGAPATLASAASTCATTSQTCVKPDATAATFGAGLSDGARSGESITISGFGFGVAPGGSRATCTGTVVDTGCVRFTVGGAATVADVSISAWSNTSITLTVSSTLASNGGASGMEVVSGGQTDNSDLTYFIYPTVVSLITCASCGTNQSREHAAGVDTDGLIQLNGDHLGASAGTVQFTGGFGAITATVHGVAEGACGVAGWAAAGTSICVEASSSISNSVYSGTITATRTGDSKTHAFSSLGILPRITTSTPTNGVIGDTIQLLGDHFCTTGTCPVSPNRSTASDNVVFGTTQAADADFLNLTGGAGACNGAGAAWAHSEICVKVPAGTPAGSRPTQIESNTLLSNTKAFTVNSSVPSDPTNLDQRKLDGTTSLSVGSSTNESGVVLRADISASLAIDMALQVEATSTASAFVCGAGACASAIQGTVAGGGACIACTSLVGASTTVNLADGTYHWQARVRNTTTNEYSAWVSFGGNPEANTDFKIDTTGPAITNISSASGGGPGTNSATITWDTSGEQGTSQVQYNKTGTFVTNCATNNDCTTLDAALVFGHSVALANLDSGATYFYRVRSKDAAGNETISANNSFTTGSVVQPAKTTVFLSISTTTTIIANTTATSTFSVYVPEQTPSAKSVFVDIVGTSSGGTNNFIVKVNSQNARTYILDTTSRVFFRVLHPVASSTIVFDTGNNATNTISITPSLDTQIVSARAVVTYVYTP